MYLVKAFGISSDAVFSYCSPGLKSELAKSSTDDPLDKLTPASSSLVKNVWVAKTDAVIPFYGKSLILRGRLEANATSYAPKSRTHVTDSNGHVLHSSNHKYQLANESVKAILNMGKGNDGSRIAESALVIEIPSPMYTTLKPSEAPDSEYISHKPMP